MAAGTTSATLPSTLQRKCFVTVGLNASFRILLDVVCTPSFFDALEELGYTNLTMQCGPDLSYAIHKLEELGYTHLTMQCEPDPSYTNRKLMVLGRARGSKWRGINLELFDFKRPDLGPEMRGCRANGGQSREGVVICHAGAGSVLDAMRVDVPMIVVPNRSLLNNHQVELAEELERQGYATHGHLENLPAALRSSEEKSMVRKAWPPENSGSDPTGRGINSVLDEEVGYELSTREILD